MTFSLSGRLILSFSLFTRSDDFFCRSVNDFFFFVFFFSLFTSCPDVLLDPSPSSLGFERCCFLGQFINFITCFNPYLTDTRDNWVLKQKSCSQTQNFLFKPFFFFAFNKYCKNGKECWPQRKPPLALSILSRFTVS